jgi:thioredoxin reductase
MSDGTRRACRKLLLATGVVDDVPEIDGFAALYGRSVFHCPYCDGWDCRDQPLAAYGRSSNLGCVAIELQVWSRDVVVCSDGGRVSAAERARLQAHGIELRPQRIARLEGTHGRLKRVVFADSSTLARRALFFSTGQRQSCDLASSLGCQFTRKGAVKTGEYEVTNIPGLYVAGDASRLVQLAIVAAAEGAQAAFAINTNLTKEDLRTRS